MDGWYRQCTAWTEMKSSTIQKFPVSTNTNMACSPVISRSLKHVRYNSFPCCMRNVQLPDFESPLQNTSQINNSDKQVLESLQDNTRVNESDKRGDGHTGFCWQKLVTFTRKSCFKVLPGLPAMKMWKTSRLGWWYYQIMWSYHKCSRHHESHKLAYCCSCRKNTRFAFTWLLCWVI